MRAIIGMGLILIAVIITIIVAYVFFKDFNNFD